MKYVITIVASFLFFILHSQDTIVRRDGHIHVAIISDISEFDVQYFRFEYPDGPIRTLMRSEIAEIRYADGLIDVFENSKNAIPSSSHSYKFSEEKKDLPNSSGFSLNSTLGYAFIDRVGGYGSDNINQAIWGPDGVSRKDIYAFHYSMVFNYRWILKEREKSKHGVTITILRLGINKSINYTAAVIGVGHIGTISSFDLKNKHWSYELGTNFGLQFIGTLGYHQKLIPTGMVSITSTWRKNRFGFGFEASYAAGEKRVKEFLYKEKMMLGAIKLGFML